MTWIVVHNQLATHRSAAPEVADKLLVNLNLADHSPLMVRLFSRLQQR